MADTYKILGQGLGIGQDIYGNTGPNIIYTVPENKQASISSVSLINSSATSASYTVGALTSTDAEIANVEVSTDVATLRLTNPYVNKAYVHRASDPSTWAKSEMLIDGQSVGFFSTISGIVVVGEYKYQLISRITFLDDLSYTTQRYLVKSLDGISWTTVSIIPSYTSYELTYFNNRFILFGYNLSTTYYSEDGVTWTLASGTSSENFYYGIDFSQNGSTIALIINVQNASYETSNILTSTDGITWTTTSLPVSKSWTRITSANETFFILDIRGLVVRSLDGITWSQVHTGAIQQVSQQSGIKYLDSLYLGTYYNQSLNGWFTQYSLDGANWTVNQHPYWLLGLQQTKAMESNSLSIVYNTDQSVCGLALTNRINLINLGYFQISFPIDSLGSNQNWGKLNKINNFYFLLKPNYGSVTVEVAYTDSHLLNNWSTKIIDSSADLYLNQYSWLIDESNGSSNYQSGTSYVINYKTVGNTVPNKTIILKNNNIGSGEVNEIYGGITLSSGDQIRVESSSEDIIVQVYGVEI